MTLVTEKFSGFLGDFLAEYQSPNFPRSAASEHIGAADIALPVSDPRTSSGQRSEMSASPAPSSTWRSDSRDLDSDLDEGSGDESTIADGESTWEDEDLDTPGSPGSDIEINETIIRRGMYITVVLTNRERSTALPCTAKILDVHDRRGKFTLRLSKSARRATRTMWGNPTRSPAASRG